MSLSSGREATGQGRRRTTKHDGTQLDLWKDPTLRGRPDLWPTRVLLRHPSCNRVLDTIRQVRLFFPELDGTCLRVGLTASAAGFASREEPCIWINPRRLKRHTIAHELVHLLQNLGFVPSGEKSADLFALARHPILVDDLPSYLDIPRGMREEWADRNEEIAGLLHRTARAAVERRDEGLRRYLVWFERELRDRWLVTCALERDARSPATPRQELLCFASSALDAMTTQLPRKGPSEEGDLSIDGIERSHGRQ